jgi:hypothetical protein
VNNNYVKIWAFCDAPKHYQELSEHGGDEDWIVHCPNYPAVIDIAKKIVDRLTVCDADRYIVEMGVIWITAHA